LATPNTLNHDAYAALHGTTYFIPTENEWYKAAYYDPAKGGGAGYWDYPTGSDKAPTAVASGTTANTAVYNGKATSPADVTQAGGLSPFGTMGQGGNVWEWNEAAIDSSSRGLRGGDWYDYPSSLAASYREYYGSPTYEGTLGFRVASVPEPASISLMLCGAIAGLLWWKSSR
jgi:formylglycine-generating enzyme required for sulfatase activity